VGKILKAKKDPACGSGIFPSFLYSTIPHHRTLPDTPSPAKPPSRSTSAGDFLCPIDAISVFWDLRREKKPSGCFAGRNPGSLYRFYANKVLFRPMKNGARIKSAIRAPIANPGILRGVDPYPTRSFFRRSSPTETPARGA
jgi:hypothetical protein